MFIPKRYTSVYQQKTLSNTKFWKSKSWAFKPRDNLLKKSQKMESWLLQPLKILLKQHGNNNVCDVKELNPKCGWKIGYWTDFRPQNLCTTFVTTVEFSLLFQSPKPANNGPSLEICLVNLKFWPAKNYYCLSLWLGTFYQNLLLFIYKFTNACGKTFFSYRA